MNKLKDSDSHSNADEAKTRSPAYAAFHTNIDKLSDLLAFAHLGMVNFMDQLMVSVHQDIDLLSELASVRQSGGADVVEHDQVTETQESKLTSTTSRKHEIVERIKTSVAGLSEFTNGLLEVLRWIPVILVTTVEAYLKDIRMFEAQINPGVMKLSQQSVSYEEVISAESINNLAEEMQARWARNFVDDGGPERWISRLIKMGARGYDIDTARKMEILWGVRHVMVHDAGVATPDFVRRHPDYGAQSGSTIKIRLDQLNEWIKVVYHFIDVKDSYFVQRYKYELPITETASQQLKGDQ